MSPRIDIQFPQYLHLRTSMYFDLSNFIGEFRNLLGLSEFKSDEDRYIELSRALASTIHNLFRTYSNRSLYGNIRLIPFRLHCYGSYTGSEHKSFDILEERLRELGDVELHFIERSKREREKGIDIMLATDMLVHAIWNNYDVAILVSGDADFEPAVRRVRDFGKKVYVAFYPYAISEKLEKVSDMIARFFPGTLVTEDLATVILTEFKDNLVNGIKTLIKDLETKNYFKPLLESKDVRENIEHVKRCLQSLNLIDVAMSLEELQKHISRMYLQVRNAVPYKYYSQLTFKIGFYRELFHKKEKV